MFVRSAVPYVSRSQFSKTNCIMMDYPSPLLFLWLLHVLKSPQQQSDLRKKNENEDNIVSLTFKNWTFNISLHPMMLCELLNCDIDVRLTSPTETRSTISPEPQTDLINPEFITLSFINSCSVPCCSAVMASIIQRCSWLHRCSAKGRGWNVASWLPSVHAGCKARLKTPFTAGQQAKCPSVSCKGRSHCHLGGK